MTHKPKDMPKVCHVVERTSPMGTPFKGRCKLCGKTGLGLGGALLRCDNPTGKTVEQAIVEAIEGPEDI